MNQIRLTTEFNDKDKVIKISDYLENKISREKTFYIKIDTTDEALEYVGCWTFLSLPSKKGFVTGVFLVRDEMSKWQLFKMYAGLFLQQLKQRKLCQKMKK